MIVNEADGMDPRNDRWLGVIDGLRIFSKEQLSAFLTEAGFSRIEVDHDPKKHRLCVLAVRPMPPHAP